MKSRSPRTCRRAVFFNRVERGSHPICHRAIHAVASNKALARFYPTLDTLRAHPEIAAFLHWVATKPPDFHAPTRPRRG